VRTLRRRCCSSTFLRLNWTGRSRTKWTPLTPQHTCTAWMHRERTVPPFRSLIAPIWVLGLLPRRGDAGRVFLVQLCTATVELPSSYGIVCFLGDMVST